MFGQLDNDPMLRDLDLTTFNVAQQHLLRSAVHHYRSATNRRRLAEGLGDELSVIHCAETAALALAKFNDVLAEHQAWLESEQIRLQAELAYLGY